MISIAIPTPLRSYTGGLQTVEVNGETVGQALSDLTVAYPGLSGQLFAEDGALRRFVNIFVNEQDIRLLDGLMTDLQDGDRLQIVPAISGGASRDFPELRRELAARIPHVDAQAVVDRSNVDVMFLDVRTEGEWNEGHIPDAVHVDRGFLEMQIATVQPDRSAQIICYCASGTRSLFAASTLLDMGYNNVSSLAGGIDAWRQAGGTIFAPSTLSDSQKRRYKRQLSIPEVGSDGQRKLLEARVLVIGLGGLGCPVSLYLAAAGVGCLGLVDDDEVAISNLHRQVLYSDAMVGTAKVANARQVLEERNPDVRIFDYQTRLDRDKAREIFADYDVIIDGTDNFDARYVINDIAVAMAKPVIHGSVYRFNGQVAVFDARHGPCYRCLFPVPPPPELAPSCAEGGVLGVLPGTIGLMMATEAIKLLLGIGEASAGRLFSYDALGSEMKTLRFGKDADCASCGRNAPGFSALHLPTTAQTTAQTAAV